MKQKKQIFTEKRHPVCCANCGTQMVSMNKYITIKDDGKTYIGYICPRRKENDEGGCGHKIFVEIKKSATDSKEAELIFGFRLVGQVRLTDKVAMIIQDNLETFETWLRSNKDKFKDKRVEIVMRIIEKDKHE